MEVGSPIPVGAGIGASIIASVFSYYTVCQYADIATALRRDSIRDDVDSKPRRMVRALSGDDIEKNWTLNEVKFGLSLIMMVCLELFALSVIGSSNNNTGIP